MLGSGRGGGGMILPIDPAQWPTGGYDVVYADPPWPYKDRSLNRGGAARHYSVMTAADIFALPVSKLARRDAMLFLWATGPNLPLALETMAAWGFLYVGVAFTWLKTNKDNTLFMGMGHYTRSNAEFCLLGKRGKALKRLHKGIPMAQIHARESHSAKPEAFRDAINGLYGRDVARVELFARGEHGQMRHGDWDFWGNEVAAPRAIEDLTAEGHGISRTEEGESA